MIITFPSGLKIEARKLKGKELTLLANASDYSTAFLQLMRVCWMRTLEPGPYTHAADGVPAWDKVLASDILAGAVRLSVESIPNGDRYVFPVVCPRVHPDDDDTRRFKWAVSLTKDLRVKAMSDSVREEMLANGNSFSTQLLSGQKATFRLLISSDRERLRKLLRLHKIKNAHLAERFTIQLSSIDGVAPDERSRYKFLLDADGDVLDDLREKIDAIDCGLETGIEVKCPECGWVQEVDIPFSAGLLSRSSKDKAANETTETETTPETES